MADPQNRQDIFDGGSVRHFALQEDQKLVTHSYFLEHHVLQPLSHDVEPDVIHLLYTFAHGNIIHRHGTDLFENEMIDAINAVPFVNSHPTRVITTSDTALFKTVAYVAGQAGNKVAIFGGLRGRRDFYSWFDIEQSLETTDGIRLLHMDLPCTDYKRKRKSMEDDTKKNVIVFDDIMTWTIPHFSSITHIIVPWVNDVVADVQWNKVYNDYVGYATRYGVMVNKSVVIIKISGY
jgi:hypothetical protein